MEIAKTKQRATNLPLFFRCLAKANSLRTNKLLVFICKLLHPKIDVDLCHINLSSFINVNRST